MSDASETADRIDEMTDRIRQHLDEVKRARQLQPDRLAQVRAEVEREKARALAAEPWSQVITGLPTVGPAGELAGMLPTPTIEGKELFGMRLAYDLVAWCGDGEKVDELLTKCFTMTRNPNHAVLVAFAALEMFANHIVPALLTVVENQSGDYVTRVALVHSAIAAWAARANDLRVGEVEE